MRFLIDENLSPRLCAVLNDLGYDATSVRDRGMLGQSDAAVLAFAVDEDRTIVTANGDDYRDLVGRVEIHPGLVILPNAATAQATALLHAVVEFADGQSEPAASFMLNRVLTVSADGTVHAELLPDA